MHAAPGYRGNSRILHGPKADGRSYTTQVAVHSDRWLRPIQLRYSLLSAGIPYFPQVGVVSRGSCYSMLASFMCMRLLNSRCFRILRGVLRRLIFTMFILCEESFSSQIYASNACLSLIGNQRLNPRLETTSQASRRAGDREVVPFLHHGEQLGER